MIDPLHSAPELLYIPCIDIFDGWFGISFKDTNRFIHVRSPCSSKI